MPETIILSPISVLLPNQSFATEKNCVNLQLSFNFQGGSFSITLLKDSTVTPPKDFILTLPFGRFGIVKTVGKGFSSGGLVDLISGPALPLAATEINFVALPGGERELGSILATKLNKSFVIWSGMDPLIKTFNYRGISLQGIQQLAQNVLADVIVYKNSVYVAPPGDVIGFPFFVDKADIVNASQNIDYSLDRKSVLNPALNAAQLIDEGDFVYDDEHAQKQPKTIVQTGAPTGTGSKDFIPIPDGWLVDGAFEEWTPPPGTDLTNPSPTVAAGRYWKILQSPTDPTKLRGITSFNRLVKEIKLGGDVSPFVGSPITGATKTNSTHEFRLDSPGSESGIFGFTADDTIISDALSGQYLELKNAIVLRPFGGSSGEADKNFYTIQLEFWTFPRVNPTIFPVGDPTNPFGLPSDVVVINPSSNVIAIAPDSIQTYWNYYMVQYRKINSPRLRTQLTSIYRNVLPQPGDRLIVSSLPTQDCGRISSVTLNFTRSGLTLNIQAEIFAFGVSDGSLFSGSP